MSFWAISEGVKLPLGKASQKASFYFDEISHFFKNLNTIIKVFGNNTPSCQILSCLYLAIAILSTIGLVNQDYFMKIALILVPMQIVYNLLTLIAVKERKNPVPYANLAISVLHAFSLCQLAIRF